jgi:hypothetical protein
MAMMWQGATSGLTQKSGLRYTSSVWPWPGAPKNYVFVPYRDLAYLRRPIKKATINQRMRLAARGGTKEGAQLWWNVWRCVSQPYGSKKRGNKKYKTLKYNTALNGCKTL